MPKISFALGLKPAKAIEWLKAKGVTAESYRNLTPSEIAKVYTIARITDLDMLNDIKQSMAAAADKGQPFEQWRAGILQHLQNKGWLHPNGHNGHDIIDPKTGEVFGSPRRLDTIYRTNMQSAYSAGQYQGYMDNIDNRPYWMYDAVGDHRTPPTLLWTGWCTAMMIRFGQRFIRQTVITAGVRWWRWQSGILSAAGIP